MKMPGTPALSLERLLLVVTGSLAAADLPFWATWLRTAYPDLHVKVAMTRTATRFVTPQAVEARLHGEVFLDEWAEDSPTATHVELYTWAEGVLVHPCTFDYLARFSLGLAGSPSLLALHCTDVPVILAPALPPGATRSPAYQEHVERLERRPNVALIGPQPGRSSVTGEMDGWAPQLFPQCLERVETVRTRLRSSRREVAG